MTVEIHRGRYIDSDFTSQNYIHNRDKIKIKSALRETETVLLMIYYLKIEMSRFQGTGMESSVIAEHVNITSNSCQTQFKVRVIYAL